MNMIFLDFDGVICHKNHQPNYKGGVMDKLDPNCVANIMKAAYLTESKIAIHSTWVYVDKPVDIMTKLIESGFDVDYLHPDWVCVTDSHQKDVAISEWILKHPDVKNYVVVDDERIGEHIQVQIRGGWFDGGFKDDHIVEVVRKMAPNEPGVGYKIRCTSCGKFTYTDTGLCGLCESKAGRKGKTDA